MAWDDVSVRDSTAMFANDEQCQSLLRVEGMHCAACALTVERSVMKVPGVKQVNVSAASGTARVQWQPGVAKLSAIAQAVNDAGYTPYPMMQARAQDEHKKAERQELWRLFVAGFCMMQVMMYALPIYQATPGDMTQDINGLMRWASWVLSLPVLFFSASPFFRQAWSDIKQLRAGMDVPVALGILITFFVSTLATFNPQGVMGQEVYFDSLTMFVFFLLCGRYIEARARRRTAGALQALMQRMPHSVVRFKNANQWQQHNETEAVPQAQLRMGDVLRIVAGQALPADGELLSVAARLDEALLTGESKPQFRTLGERLLAGSLNKGEPLVMRVTALAEQTRYSQIVQLMQRASTDKPRIARLADRLAGPFVMAVLLAAAFAAIAWWFIEPSRAALVAATVLIVTCPCALSLATPAAMLAAAGNLARRGVLVQSLQALETLAQVDQIVFDKTGTLTHDALRVDAIEVLQVISEAELQGLMQRALVIAQQSSHPVSRAIAAHLSQLDIDAKRALPSLKLHQAQELAGQGMQAQFEEDDARSIWRLGSASYTQYQPQASETAVLCILARDDIPLLKFSLQEAVRADAFNALQQLSAQRVAVSLLSGDRGKAVEAIASRLGISHAKAGCTPEQKLEVISQAQMQGHMVAMVGDGINDAPVLAKANVAFTLGDAADIARAKSDFVVLNGRVSEVVHAHRLALRTMHIVKQNLAWAALYNAICIPLALLGFLPAWLAGLGMACSSLLVVGNALRLTRD